MDGETISELPTGIRIRGNSIQIDFYYKGIRCREALKLKPNSKNIKYASKLRDTILFEIERNQFDYPKYFPGSKKLIENNNIQISCLELLEKQIQLYERRYSNKKMSITTLKGYIMVTKFHLIPAFGSLTIQELTPTIIRKWLYTLNNSSKTINNILIPLKSMLNNAVKDGYITENPLEKADLIEIIKDISLPKQDVIDPFTNEEKNLIINAATGQIKNLFQFGFWSGLRTGELIALRWHDVDFKNKTIQVNRNKVLGQEKDPKTKSGIRSILLLPKAEEALKDQFQYTGSTFDFIFHNPNTNNPWSRDNKIRLAWIKLFEKIDVRYRYPYQMRHTFASTLLSNGENPAWISTQMGHVDVEMVFKVYGKWIPNNKELGGYKLKGKY